MRKETNGHIRSQRRKRARRRQGIKLAVLAIIIICGINFIAHALKTNRTDGRSMIWAGVERQGNADGRKNTSLKAPIALDSNEIKATINKMAEKDREYKEICENYDAYPEELLAALCNNPEMLSFVQEYPYSAPTASGGFTDEELEGDFVLLNQWDKRWGYVPYGNSCIALSGCAPTCISMVSLALRGDSGVTPDVVAEYAENNGYYKPGTGTAWSLMTEGCRQFGIQGTQIGLDRDVLFQHLNNGEPVICSMRPGDFTTQGHFIVLTAVVDGKIAVCDPNSIARSQVLWDWNVLEPQIKNLWAFS